MTAPILTSRRVIALALAAAIAVVAVVAGPAILRRASLSLSAVGLGQLAYGYQYNVEFAQAAGLLPGAQVRIAGLPEGVVRSISLGHQRVIATVVLAKDVRLGDETTASIKMASVLGNQYVSLVPAGDGTIAHGGTVPLSRTSVPFTLSEIATDTHANLGHLDTGAMRRLIALLSGTMRQTPAINKIAIAQVAGLVGATAARSRDIRALIANTAAAVRMVNGERKGIVGLMSQADVVVRAVYARRTLIHQLLLDTRSMARAINAVIRKDQRRINPTLNGLGRVVRTLAGNRRLLTGLLDRMAVSGRYFANVAGSGPYASVYLPDAVLPDQALCIMGLAQGCR
ncbi:MAG TPA: MlaD family protein [Nocardioides sp.]|nr:MlaD family protein [Nocardioides sp.]